MTKRSNGGFDPKETIAARIPLGEMVIDKEYQGHLSQSLVDKIATKWDEAAAGAVILNLRDDGAYAVLDGQHRVLAALQRGVMELPALVFIGKSKEEEARLFVQLNTKHNVRPMDRFRANLRAGSIPEKNIVGILTELGLSVAITGPGEDKLQCPVALLKVYTDHGRSGLARIAGVLHAAYSSFPADLRSRGYRGEAFEGLALFFVRYPDADAPHLIAALREHGPTTVTALVAAQRKPSESVALAWGRVATELYNKGLRKGGKLDESLWLKRHYSPRTLPEVRERGKRTIEKNRRRGAPLRRVTTTDHRTSA